MEQTCFGQTGHAHGGEHSTTELDPSHRTTSPSLGNLKTNESSLTHSSIGLVSRGTPGSVLHFLGEGSLPATRVAVRSTEFETRPDHHLSPS
jgi:hypothetical protein